MKCPVCKVAVADLSLHIESHSKNEILSALISQHGARDEGDGTASSRATQQVASSPSRGDHAAEIVLPLEQRSASDPRIRTDDSRDQVETAPVLADLVASGMESYHHQPPRFCQNIVEVLNSASQEESSDHINLNSRSLSAESVIVNSVVTQDSQIFVNRLRHQQAMFSLPQMQVSPLVPMNLQINNTVNSSTVMRSSAQTIPTSFLNQTPPNATFDAQTARNPALPGLTRNIGIAPFPIPSSMAPSLIGGPSSIRELGVSNPQVYNSLFPMPMMTQGVAMQGVTPIIVPQLNGPPLMVNLSSLIPSFSGQNGLLYPGLLGTSTPPLSLGSALQAGQLASVAPVLTTSQPTTVASLTDSLSSSQTGPSTPGANMVRRSSVIANSIPVITNNVGQSSTSAGNLSNEQNSSSGEAFRVIQARGGENTLEARQSPLQVSPELLQPQQSSVGNISLTHDSGGHSVAKASLSVSESFMSELNIAGDNPGSSREDPSNSNTNNTPMQSDSCVASTPGSRSMIPEKPHLQGASRFQTSLISLPPIHSEAGCQDNGTSIAGPSYIQLSGNEGSRRTDANCPNITSTGKSDDSSSSTAFITSVSSMHVPTIVQSNDNDSNMHAESEGSESVANDMTSSLHETTPISLPNEDPIVIDSIEALRQALARDSEVPLVLSENLMCTPEFSDVISIMDFAIQARTQATENDHVTEADTSTQGATDAEAGLGPSHVADRCTQGENAIGRAGHDPSRVLIEVTTLGPNHNWSAAEALNRLEGNQTGARTGDQSSSNQDREGQTRCDSVIGSSGRSNAAQTGSQTRTTSSDDRRDPEFILPGRLEEDDDNSSITVQDLIATETMDDSQMVDDDDISEDFGSRSTRIGHGNSSTASQDENYNDNNVENDQDSDESSCDNDWIEVTVPYYNSANGDELRSGVREQVGSSGSAVFTGSQSGSRQTTFNMYFNSTQSVRRVTVTRETNVAKRYDPSLGYHLSSEEEFGSRCLVIDESYEEDGEDLDASHRAPSEDLDHETKVQEMKDICPDDPDEDEQSDEQFSLDYSTDEEEKVVVTKGFILKQHKQPTLLHCGQCKKPFASQSELGEHLFDMENAKIKCSTCHIIFKKETELKMHRYSKHGSTDKVPTVDKANAPLTPSKLEVNNDLASDKMIKVVPSETPVAVLDKTLDEEPAAQVGENKPDLLSLGAASKGGQPESDATKLKFECKICQVTFPTSAKLSLHEKDHSTELPHECLKCGKRFKKESLLKLHVVRHEAPNGDHTCPDCRKVFRSRSKLTEHMRIHTGEAPYICHLCGKRFKRQSNLIEHRKTKLHDANWAENRRQKELFCHCGQMFSTERDLNWHKEAQHQTKPQKCKFCGDVFVHSSSLTRHIRVKHTSNYVPVNKKASNSAECPVCKIVMYKTSINKHIRVVHHGIKSFSCDICKKAFVSKSNLDGHMWMHKNPRSKPFKCTKCSKAYLRESQLKLHMQMHVGVKPFVCNECGSQFTLKSNYKRHVKEHDGERSFQCSYCSKTFARRYYLTDHIKVHTRERPYVCNICGKTSATRTNYNSHMLTHIVREPVTAEV